MSMQQNNQQDRQYYEDFRYKSYDEIMQEKRRYRAMRRSMAFAAVFFLALTVLMASVGILIGSAPLNLFNNLSQQLGISQTTQGESGGGEIQAAPGEGDDDFSITIRDPEENKSDALYAQDVSGVVEKVRSSVVGVTSESYDNYNTQTSCGSGIIISTDGYIVTNYHVIEGANNITVALDDGTEYTAYLIGSDAYTDLAVIRIQQEGLTAAEFGNSDKVRVGEIAIAIGNPTGQLQGTATSGIISALNRNVEINNTVMNLIQTDAAINSGNSGGPLLNQHGQVVGITSAKVSLSGYEGLGFAIPANTAKPIIEELVRHGYVSGRPLLGVRVTELSKMAANFYRVPQGLYVQSVNAKSDAAKQGIAVGDIITAINGTAVTGLDVGVSLRNELKAGDTVTVTIYRVGHGEGQITFTLMEQTNGADDCNF